MVKHTQTIRRQHSTNCLRVFDHFVGLALQRLTENAGNFLEIPLYKYFFNKLSGQRLTGLLRIKSFVGIFPVIEKHLRIMILPRT